MIDRGCKLVTAALAAVVTISLPAVAQQVANPGFASVGRGAPLAATLPPFVPSAAMAGPPGPEQMQQLLESAARFPFVGPISLGPPPAAAGGPPPPPARSAGAATSLRLSLERRRP